MTADPDAAERAIALLPPGARLPVTPAAASVGPLATAVRTAKAYADDALSPETRRAYRADWEHFLAWCRANDAAPLPASAAVIAAYLGALAGTHGRSALNRRLSAIAHVHRARKQPWVHGHSEIRQTLRGIHRNHGAPSRPAAALTSDELRRLLATCDVSIAGVRDRALLLTGFVGALRRSELVGIDVAHLRLEAGGYRLLIPHSKRDPDRKGVVIGLPRARDRGSAWWPR